jgi:hypothetical protein
MSCNGYQWIERPSGQSRICRDFPFRVETEAIVEELNILVDRIKQLEEVGDALCENSNPSRWDSPADAARKLTEQSNWRKAKEAKS